MVRSGGPSRARGVWESYLDALQTDIHCVWTSFVKGDSNMQHPTVMVFFFASEVQSQNKEESTKIRNFFDRQNKEI